MTAHDVQTAASTIRSASTVKTVDGMLMPQQRILQSQNLTIFRVSESTHRKSSLPGNAAKDEVLSDTDSAQTGIVGQLEITEIGSPSNWVNFGLQEFQDLLQQPQENGFGSPSIAFSYSPQEWSLETDPGIMGGPGESSIGLNQQQFQPFLVESSLHLPSSSQFEGQAAPSKMDASAMLGSQPPDLDWRSPQQTSIQSLYSKFRGNA